MWLVEEKLDIRSYKNKRKVIKNEVDKILEKCTYEGITFVEGGVRAGDAIVETYCGPDRDYDDHNTAEICICIKGKLTHELAILIAKKLRTNQSVLRKSSFQGTCESINQLLMEYGCRLIILLVQKHWVDEKIRDGSIWRKDSNSHNYNTLLTYLEKKQKSNHSINEEGCYVLYGI